ncbi:MAG: Type 1 glutamine amidotransferase-like domain-containing protein [Patescibacteria group bacterium]
MRLLFLSNTRDNTNKEVIKQLRSWIKTDEKIAYFSASPDPSRKYFLEIAEWFKNIVGLPNLYYLDTNSTAHEINGLRDAAAVFLSGGNTYHLLQALRDTGAGELIHKLATTTEIPIIGVSAGGICLTRDIRAARDENDIGVTNHKGLGLVDFGFYPHHVPEETRQAEIYSFIKLSDIDEVLALPDYSGIVVTENGPLFLGEVIRFTKQ